MIKLLAAIFLISFGSMANAFQVIQGNSDEYIRTMEDLTRAKQLYAKAQRLVEKAHLQGYHLPNSNLEKILEKSTNLQYELNIILQPERLREKAYDFVPEGGYVVDHVNEMPYSKNLGN